MTTIRVIAADLQENDTFKIAGEFYKVDTVRRRFSEETIIKFYPEASSMAYNMEMVVKRDIIFKISR